MLEDRWVTQTAAAAKLQQQREQQQHSNRAHQYVLGLVHNAHNAEWG